jgi:hypothetical protein
MYHHILVLLINQRTIYKVDNNYQENDNNNNNMNIENNNMNIERTVNISHRLPNVSVLTATSNRYEMDEEGQHFTFINESAIDTNPSQFLEILNVSFENNNNTNNNNNNDSSSSSTSSSNQIISHNLSSSKDE